MCEGVIVCIVCCIRAYISTRTYTRTHTHTNTIRNFFDSFCFSGPSAEHAWSMLSRTTALYLGRTSADVSNIYSLQAIDTWRLCMGVVPPTQSVRLTSFFKKNNSSKRKRRHVAAWYGCPEGFSCMLLRQHLYFCTSKAINLCRSNNTKVSASSLSKERSLKRTRVLLGALLPRALILLFPFFPFLFFFLDLKAQH